MVWFNLCCHSRHAIDGGLRLVLRADGVAPIRKTKSLFTISARGRLRQIRVRCKAQTTAIARSMARICNAADGLNLVISDPRPRS
jgi:hypothetical protein